ncbi:MAG: sigma 54-interacting transcriptional regulator [Myxococcota bacterium]
MNEQSNEFAATRDAAPLQSSQARTSNLYIAYSCDENVVGQRLSLDGTTWILGRQPGVQMQISDDMLSRQHVRIEADATGTYYVHDLGSKNGSFVDGRKVGEDKALLGDVVRVGNTLLVVDRPPPPELDTQVRPSDANDLVGPSEHMQAIRARLHMAAKAGGGILLLGPSGAGKEVAANFVKHCMPRDLKFVPVNCAGLKGDVANTELFGHVQGAFTGATDSRGGLFQAANGGVLFLDEIGELDLDVQARLLRTLESGELRPVGASKSIEVKIRLIAATNKDVNSGEFRGDLLARICTWTVTIPPLVERRADILPIFQHFFRKTMGTTPRMNVAFAEGLLLHSWEHNARGLRDLVVRLGGDPARQLTENDLDHAWRKRLRDRRSEAGAPTSPVSDTEAFRHEVIGVLKDLNGNVTKTAEKMGMKRLNLHRRLKKMGIDASLYREKGEEGL